MVSVFPVSLCTNEVIAPTAYPGFLGIPIELKSKSFSLVIPNRAINDLKAKGLVSWK
jgi:hypothetical protein